MSNWTPLHSGKHEGKTLPWVMFHDPDWFFWALAKQGFEGSLAVEAKLINSRARKIVPPKINGAEVVVEYIVHRPTGKFQEIRLIPKAKAPAGAKAFIDLAFPSMLSKYDKFGYDLLLRKIKFYFFGTTHYRMTELRCNQFFDDVSHFGQ